MTERLDVVAMGNAIVDVLASVDDAFLDEMGIQKGIMQLIDTARADEIYRNMGPSTEISGGSAANTVAGLAALGARTGYLGKVRDDQLGTIFAHDIRAQGAVYDGPIAPEDAELETARSFILVSPDGQRSMNTYLGIAGQITPDDVDEALMHRADWLYLEGYLFDNADAKEAFRRAIGATRAGGGKVALTVSDPFCVDRHREDFIELISSRVDLLFANEDEILSLFRTDDLETAVAAASEIVECAAITRSEKGALVTSNGNRFEVPTEPQKPVDTTGAGDLFAAGFLFGMVTGRDETIAARMGCAAAGEIIAHVGARPQRKLAELFAEKGLV